MMPTEPPPDDGPRPPAPMQILAARRHISLGGKPQLTVLVDRIPRIDELTFHAGSYFRRAGVAWIEWNQPQPVA